MLLATIFQDMSDGPSSDHEGVGEQLAMAAPGYGLGAHHRHPILPCELFDLPRDFIKGRSHHEIRVGPEGTGAPSGIRRVR